MTPEQTRKDHVAQRDMVARSMLVAPTAEERSEERPRKPRAAKIAPPVTAEPRTREYRLPIVMEARYL